MATDFPPFVNLAVAKGNQGRIQVVGLGIDHRVYLAAWQEELTGIWMTPSNNWLNFAQNLYSHIALAPGADGNLQLVGLRSNEDMEVDGRGGAYLIAYQDQNGVWHPPLDSGALKAKWQFTWIGLAMGAEGHLQVIGLGLNQQAYIAAYQERSGGWYPSSPYNNDGALRPSWQFTSIILANGSDGKLQVIGLGLDERVYIVAYQDWSGGWYQPSQNDGVLRPDLTFKQLKAGMGGDRTLRIIGISSAQATDNEVFSVAYQRGFSGIWHPPTNTGNLRPEWNFKSIATCIDVGLDPRLIVLGIGLDDQLYMVAFHSNEWSTPGGNETGILGGGVINGCAALFPTYREGRVQVVTMSSENAYGQPAVATHLGQGEDWLQGQSLSQNDHPGNWNPRVSDVLAAFNAVSDQGQFAAYSMVNSNLNIIIAHFQGMARYGDYDIFTYNRPGITDDFGWMITVNRREGTSLVFDTPRDGNHPDGCQVIGDFLAVSIEQVFPLMSGYDGVVRFYWLGSMTDTAPPMLLPPRIFQGSKGAGMVGRSRTWGRAGIATTSWEFTMTAPSPLRNPTAF